MPHLTCVGHTHGRARRPARHLPGRRHREHPGPGRRPAGRRLRSRGDFTYATELVELVREVGDFSVAVAAFPEVHPRSPDRPTDRRYLAAKLEAADFGMTQFFFDADHYRRLVDELAELGCTKPVLPGVMPFISVRRHPTHGRRERDRHPARGCRSGWTRSTVMPRRLASSASRWPPTSCASSSTSGARRPPLRHEPLQLDHGDLRQARPRPGRVLCLIVTTGRYAPAVGELAERTIEPAPPASVAGSAGCRRSSPPTGATSASRSASRWLGMVGHRAHPGHREGHRRRGHRRPPGPARGRGSSCCWSPACSGSPRPTCAASSAGGSPSTCSTTCATPIYERLQRLDFAQPRRAADRPARVARQLRRRR